MKIRDDGFWRPQAQGVPVGVIERWIKRYGNRWTGETIVVLWWTTSQWIKHVVLIEKILIDEGHGLVDIHGTSIVGQKTIVSVNLYRFQGISVRIAEPLESLAFISLCQSFPRPDIESFRLDSETDYGRYLEFCGKYGINPLPEALISDMVGVLWHNRVTGIEMRLHPNEVEVK